MGRRDRDDDQSSSAPVSTPVTSAPTQTSAPDPRNSTWAGNKAVADPVKTATVATKGYTGVNPDSGKKTTSTATATSIASDYGDSQSGSIGTGKTPTAPDPISGYTPGVDGPSWSDQVIDQNRPDPVGPGEYLDISAGPVTIPGGFLPYEDRGKVSTGGGRNTTTTRTRDPIRVSTGRPTRGGTVISTGTPVQTTKDAPDKDKITCKPRPKDNRPKGGGGGGKKRGFIPWCG